MKIYMKNYAEVLRKFARILTKEGWPKVLWVDAGFYWDVIIASDGEIVPDWRFHPTGEDEGFPFFLIGPTMVRPVKQVRTAIHTIHTVVKVKEAEELGGSGMIVEEANDAGE